MPSLLSATLLGAFTSQIFTALHALVAHELRPSDPCYTCDGRYDRQFPSFGSTLELPSSDCSMHRMKFEPHTDSCNRDRRVCHAFILLAQEIPEMVGAL